MGKSQQVLGLYDRHMWETIRERRWALQKCMEDGYFRYPPSPVCPHCLSINYDWQPISGRGTILSWVIFHRQYFEDFPTPYNVIAVRLREGPIVISNLCGELPDKDWIGREVEVIYERRDGAIIPQMKLST